METGPNKLRVPVSGLSVGTRVLDSDTAHYVTRVHRMRQGDRFLAFDPGARIEADAELLEVSSRRTVCVFRTPRVASLVSEIDVTLFIGLAKGDKLEQVIASATALGATRVVAVRTERSVVRDASHSEGRLRRWTKAAVEGARQSGRGDVPELVGPLELEAALALASSGSLRICLHPEAERRLSDVLAARGSSSPAALLVGPEGGLTPAEVAIAEVVGFMPARLGQFVLRTELAAVAALALVALAPPPT